MGLQVWTVQTKMCCRWVRNWRNYSQVKDNSRWNFDAGFRLGVVGLQSGKKGEAIHPSIRPDPRKIHSEILSWIEVWCGCNPARRREAIHPSGRIRERSIRHHSIQFPPPQLDTPHHRKSQCHMLLKRFEIFCLPIRSIHVYCDHSMEQIIWGSWMCGRWEGRGYVSLEWSSHPDWWIHQKMDLNPDWSRTKSPPSLTSIRLWQYFIWKLLFLSSHLNSYMSE